jgi:hypothetical protein
MTQQKQSVSTVTQVGVGVGIMAALAGAYFLYGTKAGNKRREQVRGWMLRAKGEVLEKLEKLKDVNEEAYNRVIDTVASRYERVKDVDPGEVAALAKDLKMHWQNISRQLRSGKSSSSKTKRTPARSKSKKTNSTAA